MSSFFRNRHSFVANVIVCCGTSGRIVCSVSDQLWSSLVSIIKFGIQVLLFIHFRVSVCDTEASVLFYSNKGTSKIKWLIGFLVYRN